MKRLYNLIPIKKSLGKNDQKKLVKEAHVSFVIFGVKTHILYRRMCQNDFEIKIYVL